MWYATRHQTAKGKGFQSHHRLVMLHYVTSKLAGGVGTREPGPPQCFRWGAWPPQYCALSDLEGEVSIDLLKVQTGSRYTGPNKQKKQEKLLKRLNRPLQYLTCSYSTGYYSKLPVVS